MVLKDRTTLCLACFLLCIRKPESHRIASMVNLLLSLQDLICMSVCCSHQEQEHH